MTPGHWDVKNRKLVFRPAASTPIDFDLEPTPARVLQVVSALFEVPVRDILSPSHRPMHVAPRRVAAHLLTEMGYGASQIGRWLKRDHSSVCNSIKKSCDKEMLDRARLRLAGQYEPAQVGVCHYCGEVHTGA
jgi:hypothetical protein